MYRSNCDDYGYARSCLKYGNYSFLGKGKSGSSGSVAEAYKYYEKGCTLGEADSCLHSGLILVSRSMKEEVNRDVKKVCVDSVKFLLRDRCYRVNFGEGSTLNHIEFVNCILGFSDTGRQTRLSSS